MEGRTMQPDFSHDEEAAAIYRFLRSYDPVSADSVPTPANVPRRRNTPLSAAEIARGQGLDLGLDSGPRRGHSRLRRRSARSRQAEPSFEVFVFNLILATLHWYGREEAWKLTEAWRQVVTDREELLCWVDAVGLRRPDAAWELRYHRFAPAMLKTARIDGIPARSRLRNGEDVDHVIAALYRSAAKNPPGNTGGNG
jgi:hypothetical protein